VRTDRTLALVDGLDVLAVDGLAARPIAFARLQSRRLDKDGGS
jgi:hypothetical protein